MRTTGLVLAWVVAAVLAVAVGLVAVTSVGASMRDRGPIGNEAIRNAELDDDGVPDPDAPVVRRSIDDEFGSFVVQCQGTIATGVETRTASGWRTVSYEPGPDDDVDAVFARGGQSVEIEVFCNRGRPTVAEVERKTLPSATAATVPDPSVSGG